MTSLTSSPFMVALMQTATRLPVLLLGLPAGALADVVDRRECCFSRRRIGMLIVGCHPRRSHAPRGDHALGPAGSYVGPGRRRREGERACLASHRAGAGVSR